MPYVPGLDGLRALAVVAILLFHMGVSWMPGAVFSVTLFFTLSGYLVASLVLVEHESTGRLDLRRFWARRFRRLMPAALVTLSAVGVAGVAGLFEGERLRGDLGWALGYLSNWRSASASTGYSDLFTSETSPLLHFWSLAIEEQFYIVFPLLAWLLRRRRVMVWTFTGIAVLSTVALVATSSRNLAYYGFQPVFGSHHPFLVPEPLTPEASESFAKEDIDAWADAMIDIAKRAEANPDDVLEGPYRNACRRIDAAALDDPQRWVPTSRVERARGGVRGD